MEENGACYYVIPPVYKNIVDGLNEGKLQLIDWKIESTERDRERIFVAKIKLLFVEDGTAISFVHTYKDRDIVWTETMPYLSMWPFV